MTRELEIAGATPVPLKTTHIVRRVNGAGRRYNDSVQVPLFPGYLFFNGDVKHRYLAAKSLATIAVRDISDQKTIAWELAGLARATAECPNLGTSKLTTGQWVRIICGPLQGLEGYVLESKPTVLHLSVTTLAAAVDVEIDPKMVEAI
jgi:transcription antitermination factor NusG